MRASSGSARETRDHVTEDTRHETSRGVVVWTIYSLSKPMTAPSRSLFGPHPGQFDNTQPSRVLRHPDAKLSFASFHPLTASNVPPYDAHQDSSNPKRIVIETYPGGFSHWRFVPRARLAEGVNDEGLWPRLVDVLGYIAIVM